MSHRQFAFLALAPFCLGGCAVAAVGAAGSVGVAAVQDRTMGEAVDDATTSSQIKARLLAEGGLGEVDVEVANGLVLLSGRVISPEKRVKAEDIAWSVEGTREVANEVKIEAPGGFISNAGDEVITARVRARLIGSSSVKSVNFNVETYDGVVYLMGLARSSDELRAAAEEASKARGVQQVISYIRIRSSDADRARSAPYADGDGSGYMDPKTGEAELLGGDR